MTYRSIEFRQAALAELLESPNGTVGQHFRTVGTAVTLAAKALTSERLQRGTGPGKRYGDSFRSTVERGPRGVRLRVENTAPHAGWIEKGTRPHIIRPRKAKVLVFQVHGETVYAREVHHPGTKGYRILEYALGRAVKRGR